MKEIPLFLAEGKDAPRPDLPFVERPAITALVRDPKTGKYLGLRWKKIDWETFVTGGIEAGQTAEDAARAEVQEETGYTNLCLVAELSPYEAKFFHGPKGENRHAHFRSFLFELVDGARNELTEGELQKHEPVWLTADELVRFRLPEGHRFVFDNVSL